MSRKDYVALAEALGRAQLSRKARRIAAQAVADVLVADNWRFDRARFMAAVKAATPAPKPRQRRPKAAPAVRRVLRPELNSESNESGSHAQSMTDQVVAAKPGRAL